MYTCGLDIGEKSIHGCCLHNGSPHTVRQFCIPATFRDLSSKIQNLLDDLGVKPHCLQLADPEYSNNVTEFLKPFWERKGIARPSMPHSHARIDQLLLQAYRLQQTWWDRAHLIAALTMEADYLDSPTDSQFCLRWSTHRAREKLNILEQRKSACPPT